MLNVRPPSAWLVLLLLGGVIAAALVTMAVEEAQAPSLPMQVGLYDWRANPIGPGAEKTTELPPSSESLPFEPLFPTSGDGLADIETVWTRVEFEPAMAVKLQSGVFIMEGAAESIAFPTNDYYAELADGVQGASTLEINHAPAMVIQSTNGLGNPSSVDVILEGVQISIIGDVGQDASELIALASTIPASDAGKPIKPGNS